MFLWETSRVRYATGTLNSSISEFEYMVELICLQIVPCHFDLESWSDDAQISLTLEKGRIFCLSLGMWISPPHGNQFYTRG